MVAPRRENAPGLREEWVSNVLDADIEDEGEEGS